LLHPGDGYQFLSQDYFHTDAGPADLAHGDPSPAGELGVVRVSLFEDDDDDGTPSTAQRRTGPVLRARGEHVGLP
jgi:hypothetical protein